MKALLFPGLRHFECLNSKCKNYYAYFKSVILKLLRTKEEKLRPLDYLF